jgi:hypothetical protein
VHFIQFTWYQTDILTPTLGTGQNHPYIQFTWYQTDILTPTLGTGQNHPYIVLFETSSSFEVLKGFSWNLYYKNKRLIALCLTDGVYITLLWGGMEGGMEGGRIYTTPYNPPVYFCLPTPNKIRKEQQMLHIRVWHANHRNIILWLMRPLPPPVYFSLPMPKQDQGRATNIAH